MGRMRHPNILQFIGVCAVPPALLTGELVQRERQQGYASLPQSFCTAST